jgi:hypothetical protein
MLCVDQGGARLVSEELLQRGNNSSQGWNVRFLGGKPLLCDGLHLNFYPVQAEIASAEKITPIELTIQKKKMRTAAKIKRTPFEEENYIASAWSRPQDLPFSNGPRSIRVLGPQPEMVITNITEEVTHGKALEGTVNRVLLKLQAGSDECCSDIRVTVSCFSVLMTSSGSTLRLVSREELSSETENSVDMSNSCYRTPILVKPSEIIGVESPQTTHVGYDLPMGWITAGTGQHDTIIDIPELNRGDSSFVQLDFFRPAAYCDTVLLSTENVIGDENLGDGSLCKTDFYVSIAYSQKRSSSERQNQRRPKRISRVRPVMASSAKENVPDHPDGFISNQAAEPSNETKPDLVSLDWSGSIIWTPPMIANFSPGVKKAFPCGSHHPSLHLQSANRRSANENDFLLVDGETFSTRCSLQLDKSMDGIETEIVAVRFEVISFQKL